MKKRGAGGEVYAIACFILAFLLLSILPSHAQTGRITGVALDSGSSKGVGQVRIHCKKVGRWTRSDSAGRFTLADFPTGRHTLVFQHIGYQRREVSVEVKENQSVQLKVFMQSLGDTVVVVGQASLFGMDRMRAVDGTAIYAGKKNEVILLKNTPANLATNNSRQIFARVPGINVIENDGGGVQLGIAVRGLNPNRISEFNSRQNGYDISADALGYPESYYTPPAEALERIEVVRGAASLQYGPQFGGLLNFVFKKGPQDRPLEVTTSQTVGSYGLFNSFNSLGGTRGKWNYYAFFHHKQAEGWRKNSGFDINTLFTSASYSVNPKLKLGAEVTAMRYLMQQPGGLTDAAFAKDPRKATRSRNWFQANWLIPALTLDYQWSEKTRLNIRSFGLIANRSSLGNLISPNQDDYRLNRTLMVDDYLNVGTEARIVHTYNIRKREAALLVGTRFYRGQTHRMQGMGSDGSGADFNFLNPDDLENSDFVFPSLNLAAFAEHIFPITDRLSVTPGIRYEFIKTMADGYYKTDFQRFYDKKENPRSFPLMGLGISYRLNKTMDLYLNGSQAYSGVNFNDMRVVSPTLKVDPNLKDVTGFNIDFGYRGKYKNLLTFDLGGFFLSYNDRIGVLTKADPDFTIYRYRTNIADSRSLGLEAFAEMDLFRMAGIKRAGQFFAFGSYSWVDARYINTPTKAILNRRVEYAPEHNLRTGITYRNGGLSATLQQSYVSEQFTDATNTRFTLNAVNGVIPAYQVLDFTARWQLKRFGFSFSVNNILDRMYFTRRADGYPGPGILPSDGRSFFAGISAKI